MFEVIAEQSLKINVKFSRFKGTAYMRIEYCTSNYNSWSQGMKQFREEKDSPTKVDPLQSLNCHCRGRAHQASFTHSNSFALLSIYLFIAKSVLSSSCQQHLRKAFDLSLSPNCSYTQKPFLFPCSSHNPQNLFWQPSKLIRKCWQLSGVSAPVSALHPDPHHG